MPSTTGFVKRLVAGVLATVTFASNVAFVHSAETNFWAERRVASRRGQTTLLAMAPASQIPLPSMVPEISRGLPTHLSTSLSDKPAKIARSFNHNDPAHSNDWLRGVLSYGDIGDHYVSPVPNAPLVIHIQDAHGIKDAQQNISSMMGALQSSRGVNLVGVEGAAGTFDLAPYRAYPDQVVKDVADFFLDRGLIVGSEYAGLTLPKSLTLFGVEQGSLYAENVTALRESYTARPATLSALERLQSAAETLKQTRYSPALLEYDKHLKAYKGERESLSDFVKFLAQTYKPRSKGAPALGTNVALLLSALDLENSLDFKQVESDRARLVETLVGRLTTQALQDLVDKSVAYRSGSMGYGEYYVHLSNICQQNTVDLKKYGQLPAYINYVLTAEKIDKSSLITELDQFETNAQDALIATADERRLVTDSRLLALMDKLIRHEMTPMEWARYSSLRSNVQNLPARLEAPTTPLPNLAPFEAFCSKAIARNNAMVDRLLEKMRADNTHTALMVAGGFHTEGMTQLLKDYKVSYLVLTPKIKDIPKDSDYLDVLARDPVPLEKLIAGEKIFLVKWLAMGTANKIGAGSIVTQTVKETFQKFEALLVREINGFILGKLMFSLSKRETGGYKIGNQIVEAKKVGGQRAETMAHYAVEGLYQAVPAVVALIALVASGPVLSALVFIVSAHLFSRAFAAAHQTDRENTRNLYGLNLVATAGLFAALLFLPVDTLMMGQFDLPKIFPSTANFVAAFLSLTTLHTLWAHAIEQAVVMVMAGSRNPLIIWVANQPLPTLPSKYEKLNYRQDDIDKLKGIMETQKKSLIILWGGRDTNRNLGRAGKSTLAGVLQENNFNFRVSKDKIYLIKSNNVWDAWDQLPDEIKKGNRMPDPADLRFLIDNGVIMTVDQLKAAVSMVSKEVPFMPEMFGHAAFLKYVMENVLPTQLAEGSKVILVEDSFRLKNIPNIPGFERIEVQMTWPFGGDLSMEFTSRGIETGVRENTLDQSASTFNDAPSVLSAPTTDEINTALAPLALTQRSGAIFDHSARPEYALYLANTRRAVSRVGMESEQRSAYQKISFLNFISVSSEWPTGEAESILSIDRLTYNPDKEYELGNELAKFLGVARKFLARDSETSKELHITGLIHFRPVNSSQHRDQWISIINGLVLEESGIKYSPVIVNNNTDSGGILFRWEEQAEAEKVAEVRLPHAELVEGNAHKESPIVETGKMAETQEGRAEPEAEAVIEGISEDNQLDSPNILGQIRVSQGVGEEVTLSQSNYSPTGELTWSKVVWPENMNPVRFVTENDNGAAQIYRQDGQPSGNTTIEPEFKEDVIVRHDRERSLYQILKSFIYSTGEGWDVLFEIAESVIDGNNQASPILEERNGKPVQIGTTDVVPTSQGQVLIQYDSRSKVYLKLIAGKIQNGDLRWVIQDQDVSIENFLSVQDDQEKQEAEDFSSVVLARDQRTGITQIVSGQGSVPGATVGIKNILKKLGYAGDVSQIARAENLLTGLMSTSLALFVFNIVMFVSSFFGVDFSVILASGPSRDYIYPALGYILGLVGSQQVTQRVFNYFHRKGIAQDGTDDLLGPSSEQIKIATKKAMSSFYYGVPIIFAGALMIHLGVVVPGHLMILAIGLIYFGSNIGKLVHVSKNNGEISNFDLISPLLIVIPFILWEENILSVPTSLLWTVGSWLVVFMLVGLLVRAHVLNPTNSNYDSQNEGRRRFLKSIVLLTVGVALPKTSPAAQKVTGAQALEQYFVDFLNGEITSLIAPGGDYSQDWVPVLRGVKKDYARVLITDPGIFLEFTKTYQTVLGMARANYNVSREFSPFFVTVMLACLWKKTEVLKRTPLTAQEALRAYLSGALLDDAVMANNSEGTFWKNNVLNHDSIIHTPYGKELKKNRKLLVEMLELNEKIVIEVMNKLQSRKVNDPIFIATMLQTLITKHFSSNGEKTSPPKDLSPRELFKERQGRNTVFGAAGMTKWVLEALGLPSGVKSIGFTEGVPTGAFSGVMTAAPLLLAGALAAWMGVDLSALIQNYPVLTPLIWAFLSVGGLVGSQAVTRSALVALHQKTGVVKSDGSLSFEVADVRAATETAMSSFHAGAYPAPILATLAMMSPEMMTVSLAVFGILSIISGIVHAFKNARIARDAFTKNYLTHRTSVDSALRQFLGRQILNSLGDARSVIPFTLNPLNPARRTVRASFADRVAIAGVDGTADLMQALQPVTTGKTPSANQPTIHTFDVTALLTSNDSNEERILLAADILSTLRTFGTNPLHSFAFISTDRNVTVENVLSAISELPSVSSDSKEMLRNWIKTIATPKEGATKVELTQALTALGINLETINSAIHRIAASPDALATNGIPFENIFFIDIKKNLTQTVIQTLEAMMATADDA